MKWNKVLSEPAVLYYDKTRGEPVTPKLWLSTQAWEGVTGCLNMKRGHKGPTKPKQHPAHYEEELS